MTDIRRIIVCGSRDYTDRERIRSVLAEYVEDDPVIVHGACRGADSLAGEVATRLGLLSEAHPANWPKYGNAAGPIRNRYMAALGAELCIAFGDGKGTRHMVEMAERRDIPVRREMEEQS